MDKAFDLAASVGLPAIWTLMLIVVGNLIALFLAQVLFPLRLKKKIWSWEKTIQAEAEFIEVVSRVSFISGGYIETEHKDGISFSGLSLVQVEEELSQIYKKIHNDGHRLRPYLPKHKQILFDKFLQESYEAYVEAKNSNNNWYENDIFAEERHSEHLISNLANIAKSILMKIN